jgi:uncharacterized membrane protein
MSIRAKAALTVTVTVLVISLAWALYHPSRYLGASFYDPQDAILAQWLKQNADLSKYVIVNADTHRTATWIQALSGGPHFLYQVGFANNVSPPPYAQVYSDLKAIYDRPQSSEVLVLLSKYNVGYVVVDVGLERFMGSPFFRQVFNAGTAGIFVPVRT